jgi:hypothetical protein
MITITNPKVAGFAPRWAPFRGFSLLFDNPGRSLTPAGDRLDLHGEVEADPELGFYRKLRDSLERLDPGLLTNTYLFCPLPPASYHVTVWDGVNDGNVARVSSSQRPQLEQWLAGLPRSLSEPNELIEMAGSSSLVRREEWSLRFRFDRLVNWGNTVMVVRLAPADEASSQALNELVEERRRLTTRFQERFGIGPSETYTPHISLGYFANREAAQLSVPCLEDWNRIYAEQMQELTLPFRRISLYGFTDMATFFREDIAAQAP